MKTKQEKILCENCKKHFVVSSTFYPSIINELDERKTYTYCPHCMSYQSDYYLDKNEHMICIKE